jgi:C-terminal peptidase prc
MKLLNLTMGFSQLIIVLTFFSYSSWGFSNDSLENKAIYANSYSMAILGESYRRGDLGYKQDYTKAYELFIKSIDNPISLYNLGVMYLNGYGVETDSAKSTTYFSKAIKLFHLPDFQLQPGYQRTYGICYEFGYGIEKNLPEAVKWYRKAAEQGDARAQVNLGLCYYNGYGVQKNRTEAVKWYRKAAEQGDARVQFNLGVYYYNGDGVDKNLPGAVEWFRKAAEQGHARAQVNLGLCYYNGYGVQKNRTEAVKWYRKAAEQGHAEGQFYLGFCYDYGHGVEENLTEAMKWYQKAAEQEHEKAKTVVSRPKGHWGYIGNTRVWITDDPSKTSICSNPVKIDKVTFRSLTSRGSYITLNNGHYMINGKCYKLSNKTATQPVRETALTINKDATSEQIVTQQKSTEDTVTDVVTGYPNDENEVFTNIDDRMIRLKENFSKLNKDDLLRKVYDNYAEKLDYQFLTNSSPAEWLNILDHHTLYINNHEFKKVTTFNKNKTANIGVQISFENDTPVVMSIIRNSPAAKAGLRNGDRIISIDGFPVNDLKIEEITQLLRGVASESMHITTKHKGAQYEKQFTIQRQEILINSVPFYGMLQNKIGYISLDVFDGDASVEFNKAIGALQKKGKLKGIIIDLRNNPGGLLPQVLAIASSFLEKGSVVVETKSRIEKRNRVYRTDLKPIISSEIPVALLVNSGTASGAEILAGAIQDNKRGIILGDLTFGKGSIQSIFAIDDVHSMKITTAYYYTPSGHRIDRKDNAGRITPDIEVECKEDRTSFLNIDSLDQDPLILKAIETISNTKLYQRLLAD